MNGEPNRIELEQLNPESQVQNGQLPSITVEAGNEDTAGKKKRMPGERKDFHVKLFKTPKEIVLAITVAAQKKTEYPIEKLILFSIMGGLFLALGGCFALIVGQGVPGLHENNPGLQRFMQGFCFSSVLLFGAVIGGEVYTSNCLFMTVGLLHKTVRPKEAAIILSVSFIGNFIGCILGAYFFAYLTDVFAVDPWLTNVRFIAVFKTKELPFLTIFMRSIPANLMACMSTFIGIGAEDVMSKIGGMFIPIMAFASLQYEHAIANMFYVMNGIFYGADTTFFRFLYYNLLPVTIGNAIGGGLLLGALTWFLYVYESDKSKQLALLQAFYNETRRHMRLR